jgi:hypothetical protein
MQWLGRQTDSEKFRLGKAKRKASWQESDWICCVEEQHESHGNQPRYEREVD